MSDGIEVLPDGSVRRGQYEWSQQSLDALAQAQCRYVEAAVNLSQSLRWSLRDVDDARRSLAEIQRSAVNPQSKES